MTNAVACLQDTFTASLSRHDWLMQKERHEERVRPWTRSRVDLRSRAGRDPVFDFLFDYYSFRPSHLERWSPGVAVFLQDTTPEELPWSEHYSVASDGVYLAPASFPEHRRGYLAWGYKYLRATAERTPIFCCFGLHEWAMVYKAERPRHEQVPLRMSPPEIARFVESSDVRCTHFDAFRFFTPEAAPLNRFKPSRETTTEFDQRGCLHVNMDLYKFAYKIAPWCPSDLIADAFMVSIEARKVDMRASPYDLVSHGFEPIEIETDAGRETYVCEQRRIAQLAGPVRERLLGVYETLSHAVTGSTPLV